MEAKGTAVMTLPLFLREKHGEPGFKRWLDALSPEARDAYSRPVIATQWYPFKTIFAEPTRKVCELFYAGSDRGAWEIGRFSAAHALKGIYKLFVKLGSAEFIVNKASTIFPTFYQPCAMDAKLADKNTAQVRITKFPEPDALVEARIGGWMEEALTISGFKEAKTVIVASLTKGASATEYRVTWKDK